MHLDFFKIANVFCLFEFSGSRAFQKSIICYNLRNFFLRIFCFVTWFRKKYYNFCKFYFLWEIIELSENVSNVINVYHNKKIETMNVRINRIYIAFLLKNLFKERNLIEYILTWFSLWLPPPWIKWMKKEKKAKKDKCQFNIFGKSDIL